jgi:DNA-binding Lrp family transcriptional regulator
MELTELDRRLIAAVQDGLPLVPQPYAAVAARAGCAEEVAIARLDRMMRAGIIKRFGLVVRHHELGYHANAMTVWDIPDDEVDAAAERIAAFPCVTLCYRRPRKPPEWPYNLFAMVHGRDRATVEAQVARIAVEMGIADERRAVLFSTRRFKQRGARYGVLDDPC